MLTDAQKELCEMLEQPSYTADDYMTMMEAANEIRYLAGLHHTESTEPDREQVGEAQATAQAVCQTCNGNGVIGGPSYYAPDEGGERCPDCCDTPSYCSSVRRCTAKDASPSRECGEPQGAAFERAAQEAEYVLNANLRADTIPARIRSLAASAPTLEPVHGDVLPVIGEQILIHLASADVWEPHTVVGYYVWPDLRGDSFLQRVFVRVRHSDGTMNARMLRDIRRPDGSHYVKPTVKLPAQQPQAAAPKGLTDERAAFEAWYRSPACKTMDEIAPIAGANYCGEVEDEFAFQAWQARAFLSKGE